VPLPPQPEDPAGSPGGSDPSKAWRGRRARRAGRTGEHPRPLRSTAAALTALAALAATSLVAGSAVADRQSSLPCALGRTQAHHSEGLDSWNAAYPRPRRSLDALLVFLSFPDARPRVAPGELFADYFPSTSRFYERASYGRFTLRPHLRHTWIGMPKRSTAYRIQRDWDPAHRAAYLRDAVAVTDPRVNFRKYDIVYFVADPDAPGVDSDATKVVNFDRPFTVDGTSLNRIVTVFERHPPDRNVLAHETGHVFDLPDLYHRPGDGKGDWDTYVGDWDVMGSQFGLAPDFFGWHKWKLGWLDPHQVLCVQRGGSTRVALEPLSAPPAPLPALTDASGRAQDRRRTARLVVVRTGRASAIVIEARGARGNDASTCTQGVLVYRVRSQTESGSGPVEVIDAHPGSGACWNESVYPQLADAPLRAGERFTVPGERVRIALEVGGRTKSGAWRVTVSTG
jgi:M6 family metalloprotease-like protein